MKKSQFHNFRSKKVLIFHQSRLNFWNTCSDSLKMTLVPSSWDVYGLSQELTRNNLYTIWTSLGNSTYTWSYGVRPYSLVHSLSTTHSSAHDLCKMCPAWSEINCHSIVANAFLLPPPIFRDSTVYNPPRTVR